MAAPRAAPPQTDATWSAPQQSASASVGQPGMDDFDMAGLLRDQLSAELRQAAHDPQQADGLLLALVLDHDADVREAQLAVIERAMGDDGVTSARHALTLLVDLDPMQRLPLAALAFPVLRRRPRPQLEKLLDTLEQLIHADSRVDLHEYCLMRLLGLQLRDLLNPSAGFRPGGHRLRQRRESFARLCAIVAAHGNRDDGEAARHAFMLAMQRTLPDWQALYAVPEDWQADMDEALDVLDGLRAPDKQLVIDGLATAISADGVVTVAEAELLRVICAALHCPLPLLHARPASAA